MLPGVCMCVFINTLVDCLRQKTTQIREKNLTESVDVFFSLTFHRTSVDPSNHFFKN